MDSHTQTHKMPLSLDLVLACVWMALASLLVGTAFSPTFAFYPTLLLFGVATLACIWRLWPSSRDFGWANRLTLFRGVLVFTLVSLSPFLGQLESGNSLWLFVSLTVVALALDGADGYVARATRSETAFGARFDMELDALFILGLCVAVLALDKAGAWVLALGLIRYGFAAAGFVWPYLNQPLPESFRRKTVCVWQLVTLMVALLPITPVAFAQATLALALALLVYSFGTDIRWLYQNHAHIH